MLSCEGQWREGRERGRRSWMMGRLDCHFSGTQQLQVILATARLPFFPFDVRGFSSGVEPTRRTLAEQSAGKRERTLVLATVRGPDWARRSDAGPLDEKEQLACRASCRWQLSSSPDTRGRRWWQPQASDAL